MKVVPNRTTIISWLLVVCHLKNLKIILSTPVLETFSYQQLLLLYMWGWRHGDREGRLPAWLPHRNFYHWPLLVRSFRNPPGGSITLPDSALLFVITLHYSPIPFVLLCRKLSGSHSVCLTISCGCECLHNLANVFVYPIPSQFTFWQRNHIRTSPETL